LLSSTPRRRSVAALVAIAFSLLTFSTAAARAASLSDCTAHRGTIVAVDFTHWHGPIVRGCGLDQATGYDLLHAAGFTSAGDEHDGPGFICRLGDAAFHDGTQYPTPSQDACIVTPPASAYWAYWLALPGRNQWTYSPLGPMGDRPKPGEVELYTFGATSVSGTSGSGVPTITPDSLREHSSALAPKTTTTQTHTTTSATTSTTATRTATSTTSTATTTTSTAAAKPPATPARPRRRPRARPTTTTAPTQTSPTATAPPVVAAKPTSDRTSSGSPVPLIVGICLAAVLCGGAGWAAWRRRRYE
jgi:hypothetical protein